MALQFYMRDLVPFHLGALEGVVFFALGQAHLEYNGLQREILGISPFKCLQLPDRKYRLAFL